MPPATPPQPVPPAETVLCPRCQTGFECRAKAGGCWCNAVVLDDTMRRDLAGFYNGCLCPDCLHEIEDQRPARQSVREFLKANLKRSRAR